MSASFKSSVLEDIEEPKVNITVSIEFTVEPLFRPGDIVGTKASVP